MWVNNCSLFSPKPLLSLTTVLYTAAGIREHTIDLCRVSGRQQPAFAVCHWGVFTLRDRACGVLANESQAQWCSDRTQGPLEAPYREA